MSRDNRRRKGQQGQKQQAQPVRHHIQFDEVEVPQIHEPNPVCAICGNPIELIAEAISEPNGGYSHFDCVIAKLKEQEHVTEDEKLSYVGHGNFAVFTKDEEGHLVIKTRIPYESKESYDSMKKFVEGVKE